MNRNRRSLGGSAVEQSLRDVGFEPNRDDVALVETRRPGLKRFRVVVAQNAWNTLGPQEFRGLSAQYTRSTIRRFRARRSVALANLRRARKIVCLTESMADLTERRVRRDVEVVPVTVPTVFLDGRPIIRARRTDLGLIPGSITPYKGTEEGLRYLEALGHQGTVILAGPVGESSYRARVIRTARDAGFEVREGPLDPSALARAYAECGIIVLPSFLESLGFSVSEALLFSPNVIVSDIPAHREIVRRMGGVIVDQQGRFLKVEVPQPETLDSKIFKDEWLALGRGLDLDGR